MLNSSDREAIINSLNWFRNFIHETDYCNKLKEAEKSVSIKLTSSLPLRLEDGNLIKGKNTIAWYLFLMESLLNEENNKYEFYQGARVLPLFIKIGKNIDDLKEIGGINKKIRELWKKKYNEADPYLFEILIALMWKKKGWDVEFLAEDNKKQPDLRIFNDSEEIYIECKRQKKTSDYSYKENIFRQKMFSEVAPLLSKNNLLLEIDFFVELSELSPKFLLDKVNYLINKNLSEIVHENCKIKISNIDILAINNQLKTLNLTNYDPYFINLILKEDIDGFEFSYGFGSAEFKENTIGCLKKISSVCGVKARSLSNKAIEAKARAISSLIKDAKEQLKSKEKTIIHVLIESIENDEVVKKQEKKILENLNIDKIDYLFLHRYKSFPKSNQLFDNEESFQVIKNSQIDIDIDDFFLL